MEPGLLKSADWPLLIDLYFFLGGLAGGALADVAGLAPPVQPTASTPAASNARIFLIVSSSVDGARAPPDDPTRSKPRSAPAGLGFCGA